MFCPLQVESLVLFAGERYDFVLNANESILSNHWMRVYGLADCSVRKMRQESILRYIGAADEDPSQNVTYQDGNRDGLVNRFTS